MVPVLPPPGTEWPESLSRLNEILTTGSFNWSSNSQQMDGSYSVFDGRNKEKASVELKCNLANRLRTEDILEVTKRYVKSLKNKSDRVRLIIAPEIAAVESEGAMFEKLKEHIVSENVGIYKATKTSSNSNELIAYPRKFSYLCHREDMRSIHSNSNLFWSPCLYPHFLILYAPLTFQT
jgi:septum formation topological specificity factor MinE